MNLSRVASAALSAFLLLSTVPAVAGKDSLPRKIFINIEAVYAEHLEKNHIDVASDITFELIEHLTARGFQIVNADQGKF
jgi:hypothetical protein